ncbi:MAG: class I SAM-dependent methyltransferase [Candidatus Doudnabacteria bacterium]|nr:class I SAM-dependent methyltransferase [Candidatus Doudnabacteria bacterium]
MNLKKFLLKPLYKINLIRKIVRSYFTNRHLSVTLFGKLYFNDEHRTWRNTRWMGIPVWKLPLDLWIYQEMIYELKPDVIVETGTNRGGSALFMAHMLDLIGKGRILTVDIEEFPNRPQHPRISYLTGSSIADEIISQLKSQIKPGETVLAVLDSLHRKHHVDRELELYGELVTPGSYMILEDTYLNGYPVYPSFGPGPMEAVREFLKKHPEFQPDASREKFYVTWNPRGYLKKT